MIEAPDLILLARGEPETDENRVTLSLLEPLLARAQWLWQYRWIERLGEWKAWNAVALRGPFGRWHTVDFQTWVGMGEVPLPRLSLLWRWKLSVDALDPVEVDHSNPPVLVGCHRIIRRRPQAPGGKFDTRLDRTAEFFRSLESYGILHDPRIHTQKGFDQVLSERYLRLGKWKVEPKSAEDERNEIPRTIVREIGR